MEEQRFYYSNLLGRLLGNKAREELLLRELRSIKPNDFFLDVGCAQGHFEKHAVLLSSNVFGADFALEKLRQAKQRCNSAYFTAGNAELLPFKSDSFDFVLCSEVLEHVPDWKKAFLEIQRIARKKILVTVPLEKNFFWRFFSLFAPMRTRGHLHMLDSKSIAVATGKKWRLAKHQLVATPSRKLNSLLGNCLGERLSIFAAMLFEKK